MTRHEYELPECIKKWGWKYHHLGIPTVHKMPSEKYLPVFKMFISGFPTCPFGIEWMRFEPDSPVNLLVQHVPHLAFEVIDLDLELVNHNFRIITPPNSPMDGIRVAMIEYNRAPVELIEFK